MLLAFVPLFFAVASVTRATLLGARETGARALGRAVAADVGEVRARGDRDELRRVMESHAGFGAVEAGCVWNASGETEACAGAANDLATMTAPPRPYREFDTRL